MKYVNSSEKTKTFARNNWRPKTPLLPTVKNSIPIIFNYVNSSGRVKTLNINNLVPQTQLLLKGHSTPTISKNVNSCRKAKIVPEISRFQGLHYSVQ